GAGAGGEQGMGEPRARKPRRQRNAADGEKERQIVEQELPAAQIPPFAEPALLVWQKEPAGAAGETEVVERDAGELGGRDGEEREVDALDAEAEAEPADDRARRHRGCDRRNDADP